MPQLLTLGAYESETRTGLSVRLRCVVDRVLELPEFASDTTPVPPPFRYAEQNLYTRAKELVGDRNLAPMSSRCRSEPWTTIAQARMWSCPH